MSKDDDINFKAQARGRKANDDWDAYMVGSLRALGKEIGQEREYNRRAEKYLEDRGYGKR